MDSVLGGSVAGVESKDVKDRMIDDGISPSRIESNGDKMLTANAFALISRRFFEALQRRDEHLGLTGVVAMYGIRPAIHIYPGRQSLGRVMVGQATGSLTAEVMLRAAQADGVHWPRV